MKTSPTVLYLESSDEEKRNLMELSTKTIKLPYTLKNRLLMKEGTHNGVFYPGNELETSECFGEHYSLFLDHEDKAGTYMGYIIPETYNKEDGGIYGNVHITDIDMATKLNLGAKLGLSPTVDVDKLEREDSPPVAMDPQFLSWSIVTKPAVRETMLNSKEEIKVEDEKIVEKVANRVVEMLAKKEEDFKQKKKAEDEKLSKLTEKQTAIEAELAQYKDQEKMSKCNDIRIVEEFLSTKEDTFASNRKETLLKMETATLSALQDSMMSFVSEPEQLSAFTDFVAGYMKKNKGAKVAEAAKAYKKEKMKTEEEKKKAAPSTEANNKAIPGKEEMSMKVPLTGQAGIRQRLELADQANKKHTSSMHKIMLAAQGGL